MLVWGGQDPIVCINLQKGKKEDKLEVLKNKWFIRDDTKNKNQTGAFIHGYFKSSCTTPNTDRNQIPSKII
ncbi:hypothetical protein O0550_23600 [Brevibacillus halotolerans]|uniref:hypothetical protein n=1 Tax=Brevibacillus TaxID=55080 RepID=UPI00215BA23F|nr:MULTISPECIES: hypothetical protein [Brevibacillus]MCR8966133.1 hypothetical protein [Brevibacillus laterosporus]MCZ0838290.1 hypothetical protein [Brevibacillus halotolerans]